jgi:microcystin-dependent protein
MSSPFLAEIRIFGFDFAPTGWAQCNGQIMSISQNTALFSLLGTYYGGDGKTTFKLPNLEGAVPINQGQGPGLSDRFLGESAGAEAVTLTINELPAHNHIFVASTNTATTVTSSGNQPARGFTGNIQANVQAKMYSTQANPTAFMNPNALGITGSSLPHNNMMPYMTLNFCVALQGIFPARG